MGDGKLAFVDTETTGLDPVQHEVWEVGLVIPADEESVERQYVWQLPVDLGKADPMSLSISGWYGRRLPHVSYRRDEWVVLAEDEVRSERKRADAALEGRGEHVVPAARMDEWAALFAEVTDGRHLVGAVVSFDEKRLERLLRKHHACPTWHYHIVDSEALAAGMLGMRPPWRSDGLSRALGVEPDRFERHTALGDARWAKAMFEAVMEGKR